MNGTAKLRIVKMNLKLSDLVDQGTDVRELMPNDTCIMEVVG